MSRRQLILLLVPSFIFLMFSAASLFTSTKDTQVWQNTVQREPAFQGFVDDVRSGKRQMTAGLWIDIVSVEHDSAKSQSELLHTSAGTLRDFGLFSLLIALMHIWVVLSVRKDLIKP
jgi:hypothetical protein